MTSTTTSSFDERNDTMIKGPNIASMEEDDNQNLIDFDEDDDGNNHEQENETIPKTDFQTSQEQQRPFIQSNANDTERSINNVNTQSETRDKKEKYKKDKNYESKSNTSNQINSNLSFDRLNSGLYIPPRKRKLLEQARLENQRNNPNEKEDDPASVSIQRKKWEDLKKDINGTINRLNTSTIKPLLGSLFEKSNLIRGRGILTRTLLKAATTSPSFAHVYAAFIAVINTKLPEIGELLVTRSILAFRRFYRRREKRNATAISIFIGHLINQRMAHELLGLQILALLLDGDATDDSVEIAVALTKTIGKLLSELSPSGLHAILERFRALLQEGSLSNRIQYQLEQLFQTKKKSWEGYPTVIDDLDLVEEDDQITFETSLDDDLKKEDILDVFRVDDDWLKNEQLWKQIQDEILGRNDDASDNSDDDDSDTQSGQSNTDSSSDDSDSDSDANHVENTSNSTALVPTQTQTIQDLSESDLIHLRRTIYLTIMSSATFEECAHKLAKTNIPLGKESELINMLIECCSQERTFLRYYALVSARFCILDKRWKIAFEESLKSQYETIHRLETNKLRNVAKLFAHLFHTHSFSWENLNIIKLNEEDTTSSSRIFIKILLQEMAEAMGMQQLKQQLEMSNLEGMFPMNLEKPRDTRFAINFFTSIGLGPLTDGLREFLKNAPKLILAQAEAQRLKNEADDARSTSSSELSSSSSGSSSYLSSSSYYSSSSSNSSYSRNKRGRSQSRSRRRRRYSSDSSSSFDSRSYSSSSSRSYSSYSSSDSYSNKGKSSKSKGERNRSVKNSKDPKKSLKDSKNESNSPRRKERTKKRSVSPNESSKTESSKKQDHENNKDKSERSISRSPNRSSKTETSKKQDHEKSKDRKESKRNFDGRREKHHSSRDMKRSKSPNEKSNKHISSRERSYSRSRSPSRSDENDRADNRHASRNRRSESPPTESRRIDEKSNKHTSSRERSYSRSRSSSRSNENDRAENLRSSRGRTRSKSPSVESRNKKKPKKQKYSSRERSYSRSRSPSRSKRDSNDRGDKRYSSRSKTGSKSSSVESRSKNDKSNKQKYPPRRRSYSRSRSYSSSDSRSSSYSSSRSRSSQSNSISSKSSKGSRNRRRGDGKGEKRRRRKDSDSVHADEANDDRKSKRRK